MYLWIYGMIFGISVMTIYYSIKNREKYFKNLWENLEKKGNKIK